MKRIGEYLSVQIDQREPGRKTDTWQVFTNHGGLLGHVAWFGRWRQYTFDPEPGTGFNRRCLLDLAAFLDEVNKAHRSQPTQEDRPR